MSYFHSFYPSFFHFITKIGRVLLSRRIKSEIHVGHCPTHAVCVSRVASVATARRANSSPDRSDGKRFVVRADEELTAFLELQSAIENAKGVLPRHDDGFQVVDQPGEIRAPNRPV